MSDISVSERRLSAALDRIDQFLDRSGVVAAGSGSDLRAELEAAQAQIDALVVLLKDIMARHGLKPGAIIGHSDIAPQRKVDPGPLFPWKRLADEGLVPWPNEDAVARQQALFSTSLPSVQWFQEQLAQQGYTVPQHGELDEATRNVIAAFQMKYRPANHDGQPDAETAARLLVLNLQAAG